MLPIQTQPTIKQIFEQRCQVMDILFEYILLYTLHTCLGASVSKGHPTPVAAADVTGV